MNEMNELLKYYNGVVFLDAETTGLDPEKAQIIEFAAIKVNTAGIVQEMDEFIRLPEGKKIPDKIVALTGITNEMLETSGITEGEMASRLEILIPANERVLLVAHNAHFDLRFLKAFIKRHPGCVDLRKCDFLDTLSVYKDRAEFPHKLCNAIEHYGLEGKVQNSHRAIDDVKALYELTLAMSEESGHGGGLELFEYINLFGYNPKYGLDRDLVEHVIYAPQPYSDFKNGITLPEKAKKNETAAVSRIKWHTAKGLYHLPLYRHKFTDKDIDGDHVHYETDDMLFDLEGHGDLAELCKGVGCYDKKHGFSISITDTLLDEEHVGERDVFEKYEKTLRWTFAHETETKEVSDGFGY